MKRKQQEPAAPTRKSSRIRAELDVAAAAAAEAQAAPPQPKAKPAPRPRKKAAPKTKEPHKPTASKRRSTRLLSAAPVVVPPPAAEPELPTPLPAVAETSDAEASALAPSARVLEDKVVPVPEVVNVDDTPVLVPAAARRRKAKHEEEDEAPANPRAGKRARTTTTTTTITTKAKAATTTKSSTTSKAKPKASTTSKGKGKAKAAPTTGSDGSEGTRPKRSWFKNKSKLTFPDELVSQAAPQEAPPRCKVCKGLDLEAQKGNGHTKRNYTCEECGTRRSGSSNSTASVVDEMFAPGPSGSGSSSSTVPLPELPVLEQAPESAERTTSSPGRPPSPVVEEMDDDDDGDDKLNYQLPQTPLQASSRRSEPSDTVSPAPQRSQPRWSFTSAQVPQMNDLASFHLGSTRPGPAEAGASQPRAMVLYERQAANRAPPPLGHQNPQPLLRTRRSLPSPPLPPPSPDTPPPADIMPWHLASSERRQWYRVRRLRFWEHLMRHVQEEERNLEAIMAEEGRRLSREVPKDAPLPEGLGGVLGMSVMNAPPRAGPGVTHRYMGDEERRRIAHLRYRDYDRNQAMGLSGVVEAARMEHEEETAWVDLVTMGAMPWWMWKGPLPDASTVRLPDEDFWDDDEGGGDGDGDEGEGEDEGEDEDEDEDGDDQPPYGGGAASSPRANGHGGGSHGYGHDYTSHAGPSQPNGHSYNSQAGPSNYAGASNMRWSLSDSTTHAPLPDIVQQIRQAAALRPHSETNVPPHHGHGTSTPYEHALAQAAQANHQFQPRYWNAGASQNHGYGHLQRQQQAGMAFRGPSDSHPRLLPRAATPPPLVSMPAPPAAPRIPPRLLQPMPGYSHNREQRLEAIHKSLAEVAAHASNAMTAATGGTRGHATASPTERDAATPTPPPYSARRYAPSSPEWQPDSPPRDLGWGSSGPSRAGSKSPKSPKSPTYDRRYAPAYSDGGPASPTYSPPPSQGYPAYYAREPLPPPASPTADDDFAYVVSRAGTHVHGVRVGE